MKRRISHGQATRSTLMFWRVIHFIGALNSRSLRDLDRGPLRASDGFIDHHPRDRFSVLFLLWRVNAMGLRINGNAMDRVLDRKVFEVTGVLWIGLMKGGERAPVKNNINAAQASIEFDDIWSVSKREKRDWYVLVQIEHGHQIVLFTGKKRAMMLRVQRHSVISLASSDGISAYSLIRRRINDDKDILVL